jgi:CRP/FNR family transcriptional regulator, cyclic AMP receptor protein
MSRQQYLDHLASVPLFSACSKKELQAIARASVEVDIQEGRTFVEQGQTGREAFVIVDGRADVKRNGKKIASLGPGGVVGELALLDRGPRTASVTATSSMKVLVLGPREFSGLLDEVPTITHKILAALASKVRELDKANFG